MPHWTTARFYCSALLLVSTTLAGAGFLGVHAENPAAADADDYPPLGCWTKRSYGGGTNGRSLPPCNPPVWVSAHGARAASRQNGEGYRETANIDDSRRSARAAPVQSTSSGTSTPTETSVFNAWSNSVITSATLPGDLDDRQDGYGAGQLYASASVIQFQAAANGSLAESVLLYMVSETGLVSRSWLYQRELASWVTLEDPIPDAAQVGLPYQPGGPKRIWPSMAVAHIVNPPDDDFIDTIFLFGGATFSGVLFNDTWRLNDFRWHPVETPGYHGDLARFRHSAVGRTVTTHDAAPPNSSSSSSGGITSSSHECQYFVFGGMALGIVYPLRFLNDLWLLSVEQCESVLSPGNWSQLTVASESPLPSPRVHAMLQFTTDGRLLMFGGWSENFTTAEPSLLLRDLWELDVTDLDAVVWQYKGAVNDRCALPPNKDSPSVTPPASYLPELDIVVVYTMDCSDEPIHRGQALLHVFDRATQLWSLVSPSVPYDLVPYLSMHPANLRSAVGTDITLLMRRPSQDTGEFLYVPFQLTFSRCAACSPKINATAMSPWGTAAVTSSNTSATPSVNGIFVQLGTPPEYLPKYSTVIANLRVYRGNIVAFIVGGFQGNYTTVDGEPPIEVVRNLGMSIWLFEHTEKTWSRVAPVPAPSQRSGFTIVSDNLSLFLFGGYFLRIPPTSSIPIVEMHADLWCFNFTSLEWTMAAPPNIPEKAQWQRLFHSAVMDLAGKRMVIFGGFDRASDQIRSDVLTWSLRSRQTCAGEFHSHWRRDAPRLVGHSATLSGDSMYVFGGITEDAAKIKYLLPSFHRLNLTSMQWTDLSRGAPYGRVFHNAALLGNKLVISGGCSKQSFSHWAQQAPYYYFENLCQHDSEIALSSIGVYDIDTGDWLQLPVSNSPGSVFLHTSFVIEDHLHIMGGSIQTKEIGSLQGAGLFNVQPACPTGSYTGNFSSDSCHLCDEFSYTDESGARECVQCAGQSMTGVRGATAIGNCSRCVPDVCHGNGECTVTAVTGVASCSCEFGFVPSDNCLLPIYYLLICFAILLQVLLVLSIVVYRKYTRHRRAERTKARQLRISRKEVSDLASAWEISSDEIVLKKRIDTDSPGGFGEVWLAEYRDMQVAVKKLHRHLHDASLQQEFEREVETLRRIRHPNIVLFLGTGTEKGSDLPFLVLEYMQRGTLYSILARQEIHVDHVQRLRFALDAARGMRFLHSLKPPRIHRDLKSANLVISERWILKVADFGAARTIPNIGLALENERDPKAPHSASIVQVSWPATLPRNRSLSKAQRRFTEDDPLLRSWAHLSTEVGTFAWSSPELLQRKAYGSSTDVYSFGIVMWELYTRQEPFSEYDDCRMISDLVEAIVSGRRPSIPSDCPPEYRSLIELCWHREQVNRPAFIDLVPRLDNLMESWASRGISSSLQASGRSMVAGNGRAATPSSVSMETSAGRPSSSSMGLMSTSTSC
ncbi:uncharacterized protein LOC135811817 [Sycon ciliatum]|uniref:uncharacterized protein LOC135811817 n=1 Tax=Sycon ciliatum TaxID=27933 RepID=UPI0031F62854